MKYFILIALVCIGTVCQSQTNLLTTHSVDSLRSYSYGFGETNSNYIFSAKYYKTPSPVTSGDPYHSARLIAINKLTGQQFARNYDKTGDTSYLIIHMEVLHDTVHSIRISLWREQPNDIYHFRLYSERLNSQLQTISSRIIQTVDDTAHVFLPAQCVLFNENVYYIANYYHMPQWTWLIGPSVIKYSIYDRHTDTAIVKEQRLNPEPWRSNAWRENAPLASTDDSGNIIASVEMSGNTTTGSYLDNILVTLKRSNGYLLPEGTKYFAWDSTALYEMYFYSRLPYVARQYNAYYFISSSVTTYYNNANHQSNNKIGVYKGYYRDSCIKMDTCYNTPRDTSYTNFDFGVAFFPGSFKQLVFKNDTILFAYLGNDWVGSFSPYPCQDSLSALEIVTLDTNLALLKKFTILDYQRNAAPYGYDFTKDGAIVVYGALCPRGGSLDSLNLFAFLIDFKTGFPLNIFNAEGFINTNVYKAYPNPMSNELIVEGMKSATATIILYDMQGKKLKELPVTDYKTVIDTRNLPPGLYIYQVTDAVRNIHQSGKIMKQ